MPIFFADEIALLSNPYFFEQKTRATEKLKYVMEQTREALLAEIRPQELLAPSTTDFLKGQIAKGENYEGYPYVMLDFPKQFSKESIFTFRTLFWYGHSLIFSIILAGEHLEHYRTNFERHYDSLCNATLYFGIDDVWDWREHAALLLTKENKADLLRRDQPFIKLMKRFSPAILSDEQRVLSEAKKFYQTVKPVIQK
ncbi:MAG: hypothetical protein ACK412_10770 [Chloroherpetonaceae bacterium]